MAPKVSKIVAEELLFYTTPAGVKMVWDNRFGKETVLYESQWHREEEERLKAGEVATGVEEPKREGYCSRSGPPAAAGAAAAAAEDMEVDYDPDGPTDFPKPESKEVFQGASAASQVAPLKHFCSFLQRAPPAPVARRLREGHRSGLSLRDPV